MLNPNIAIAALDAIKAAGGGQKLATFDLSPDVLDVIDAGDMSFAIDQQQYLQGYLAEARCGYRGGAEHNLFARFVNIS